MSGEFDSQQVITELLPTLHADTRAHLYFWSEADLIQWCDEALKRLADEAMVFVERDTSQTTAGGTAIYPLPSRQLATIHISAGTSSLRPATAIELEARDPAYATAPGTPDHWYQDTIGLDSVGLAPVPTTAVALPLICVVYPLDLDVAKVNTLVQAPAPLKGYLAFAVIARAYGRESETEQPDLAQHATARLKLYEAALVKYFGPGL